MPHAELARTITAALERVVDDAAVHLAGIAAVDGRIPAAAVDAHQAVGYDLAAVASATAAARALCERAEDGGRTATAALVWAADVWADLAGRSAGRRDGFGVIDDVAAEVADAVRVGRDPATLVAYGDTVLGDGEAAPRRLPEDLDMVRDAFRRFAEDRVRPIAERVHRFDEDIPDEIIDGLAEMGCFGLSIPERFGGSAEGDEDELATVVVVTEELSRASLGVAGSLITRPEIIGTAILQGGTDAQRQRWLPPIAAGEAMCAVAVTEPDVGSDVAAVSTTATRAADGWIIDGVKTWCTFAGRADLLLVLARTDPDRSLGHRGLSLFVLDTPRFHGHAFTATQPEGGQIDAKAIATLGYRGMHSFELAIDGWRVPADALIGEEEGEGRGFYLQMQAFANARLQTAARALGVMQAALEEAVTYTAQRTMFGRTLASFELTRVKIARMAAAIAANRAFAFDVAGRLGRGGGQLEASQVKQVSCRTAEWVTREAQQLHGGYGYAEEYTVSRLFVDARVLSIFEGADEVLALRVICRELLRRAIDA